MFHHELLLFDHHTINNKKYYTRLDQLKSIIHIRKKESLTTNKRSLIMKSCKILERFLRILLLSFVSTIIKLCKNFQDWRKWMFETRNEYYSSRMIYIYISICSKFFLLSILHQWNETVKDRPGERSLCYKEILSSLLVPSTNFQNFWSKSLDNFMESQTHNIFIPSKRLSNTFPFPIHISLSLISHSVPLFDDSLNENERIIEGTEREDNTEESRPVIDELSRRVIRGERIGEDSRASNPSLSPLVRNYNQPWSVISGWIPEPKCGTSVCRRG